MSQRIPLAGIRPANIADAGSGPELGRALEKEMAIHSSIHAWEIPWTEEPDGLQFMGSQKAWTRLRDETATIYLSPYLPLV